MKLRDDLNISVTVVKPNEDLEKDRELFISTTLLNYWDVPLADLDQKLTTIGNIFDWLNTAFDEEEALLNEGYGESAESQKKRAKFYYLRAFFDEKFIGFVSFQEELSRAHSLYLRQMVIHPDFQRKGIGKQLFFSVIKDKDLSLATKTIFFITRFVNFKTINFCKKYGFKRSSYMHKNYDSTKYVGFQWKNEEC